MSILAETYVNVVFQIVKEIIGEASTHPSALTQGIVGNATAGSALEPSEDTVISVLRRNEARIWQIINASMGSSSFLAVPRVVRDAVQVSAADPAGTERSLLFRRHVAVIVSVINASRSAAIQYLLGGSGLPGTGRSASGSLSLAEVVASAAAKTAMPVSGSTSSAGSAASLSPSTASLEVFKMSISMSTSATRVPLVGSSNVVGGQHATPSPLFAGDATAARRSVALVDIIWMFTLSLILEEAALTPRAPIQQNATPKVSDRHNTSNPEVGHAAAVRTPSKIRDRDADPTSAGNSSIGTVPAPAAVNVSLQHSVTSEDSLLIDSLELTLDHVISLPLPFFLSQDQLTEIENLTCNWVLRDVDVYPPLRKLVQQWSLHVFSLVTLVDASVAPQTQIDTQLGLSTLVDEIPGGAATPLTPAADHYCDGSPLRAVVAWLASPVHSSTSLNYVTTASVDMWARTGTTPLALLKPASFVEKYVKGVVSMLGDLPVYKNYSGLHKYLRLLGSLRIGSNALLVTLTSLLVELAAACKGKKELKPIFAEFAVQLLVPIAHTPPAHVDQWVLRNCEFIQMQHLTEWEGKAKYHAFVIPCLAACLGCSSIAYFVRQVLPFCQFALRFLNDCDRKLRGPLIASLHHVISFCFQHVLSHEKLKQDSAALHLRRDILSLVQHELASNLRRQALSSSSARAVEASTEFFLTLIRYFPAEAIPLVVELLPAEASASSVLTEAAAVGLSVISLVSDACYAPHGRGGSLLTAYFGWSSQERCPLFRRMLSDDETAAGVIAFQSNASFSCVTNLVGGEIGTRSARPLFDRAWRHVGRRRTTLCIQGREHPQHLPHDVLPRGGTAAFAAAAPIFVPEGVLDSLDTIARRIGTACLFERTPPQQRHSIVASALTALVARADVLVRRLSSFIQVLKEHLVVPPLMRASQRTTAAATVFISSLSEKDRAAQKILVALLLAARYWAPVSALFCELPRAAAHWNAELVSVVSGVILPHFLTHPNFRVFGAALVSRFVEAVPLYHDDKETVVVCAAALADMAQLQHRVVRTLARAFEAHMSHCTQQQRLHIPCDLRLEEFVGEYEGCVRQLLAVASFPQVYYHLPPLTQTLRAVDMQGFAVVDLLDGVAAILLGNGERLAREHALTIVTINGVLVDQLVRWNNSLAKVVGALPLFRVLDSVVLQRRSSCPLIDVLSGVSGRSIAECSEDQIESAQATGCNWAEDSKNFRVVSSVSMYSSAQPCAPLYGSKEREAGGPRAANHNNKTTATAPHLHQRLHFDVASRSHDDDESSPAPPPSDDAEANSGQILPHGMKRIDPLLYTHIATTPLPCVVASNMLLEWMPNCAGEGEASGGGATSLTVCGRIAAYICQQCSVGTSSLDDRYVMDCWRSAFLGSMVVVLLDRIPYRTTTSSSVAATTSAASSGKRHARRGSAATHSLDDTAAGRGPAFPTDLSPIQADRAKRITEMLQLSLTLLAKQTTCQDVFDTVVFCFDRLLLGRVAKGEAALVLHSDAARLVIEFVRRFLEDPVKIFARKDKKRALSYCAVALPALHLCASTMLLPNDSVHASLRGVYVQQQQLLQAKQLSRDSARGSAIVSGGPSAADKQLLLVKLFDTFDVLWAVLITGNFSSSVAGSNAPTSSSSATLAPQQSELIRTGGVSTLAALPPIPPVTFAYHQHDSLSAESLPPVQQRGQVRIADEQWPLSAELLAQRSAPMMFSGLSWSHRNALTFEQSFSVRLRQAIIHLLQFFYQCSGSCYQFLRDRHRALLEFLIFNVVGSPTKVAVRSILDTQVFGATGSLALKAIPRQAPCCPVLHYAAALDALLPLSLFQEANRSGLQHQQTSSATTTALTASQPSYIPPDGFVVLSRVIDNMLESFVPSQQTIVSSCSNLVRGSKSPTASLAPSSGAVAERAMSASCFAVDLSPFTLLMQAVASDAPWASVLFRFVHNRLMDATLGTRPHLFFFELALIMATTNPLLLVDDSQGGAQGGHHGVGGPVNGGHRRTYAKENEALSQEPLVAPPSSVLRSSSKAQLLVFTALVLLGADDATVGESPRIRAVDFLELLYSERSGTGGARVSTSHTCKSRVVQRWMAILKSRHYAELYHPHRGRNLYNKLLDVAIYYLASTRIVSTAVWIGATFGVAHSLTEVTELTEEKLRSLVGVCRQHQSIVGDAAVEALWSGVNKSSAQNRSRCAFYLLRFKPCDMEYVFSCLPLDEPQPHGGSSNDGSMRLNADADFHGISQSLSGSWFAPVPHHSPALSGEVLNAAAPSTTNFNNSSRAGIAPPRNRPATLRFALFCQCWHQLRLLRSCGLAPSGPAAAGDAQYASETAPLAQQHADGSASSPASPFASVWKESLWKPSKSLVESGTDVVNELLDRGLDSASNAVHLHEMPVLTSTASGKSSDKRLSRPQNAVIPAAQLSASSLALLVGKEIGNSIFTPLVAVLTCMAHVSDVAIHDEHQLYCAAFELGLVDRVPRSSYVKATPQNTPSAAQRHVSGCLRHVASDNGGFPKPPPRPPLGVGHGPGVANTAGARTGGDPETESLDSDDTIVVHDEVPPFDFLAEALSTSMDTEEPPSNVASEHALTPTTHMKTKTRRVSASASTLAPATAAAAVTLDVVDVSAFRRELLRISKEVLTVLLLRAMTHAAVCVACVPHNTVCLACTELRSDAAKALSGLTPVISFLARDSSGAPSITLPPALATAPHNSTALVAPLHGVVKAFVQTVASFPKSDARDAAAAAVADGSWKWLLTGVVPYGLETDHAAVSASSSRVCSLASLVGALVGSTPRRILRLWTREELDLLPELSNFIAPAAILGKAPDASKFLSCAPSTLVVAYQLLRGIALTTIQLQSLAGEEQHYHEGSIDNCLTAALMLSRCTRVLQTVFRVYRSLGSAPLQILVSECTAQSLGNAVAAAFAAHDSYRGKISPSHCLPLCTSAIMMAAHHAHGSESASAFSELDFLALFWSAVALCTSASGALRRSGAAILAASLGSRSFCRIAKAIPLIPIALRARSGEAQMRFLRRIGVHAIAALHIVLHDVVDTAQPTSSTDACRHQHVLDVLEALYRCHPAVGLLLCALWAGLTPETWHTNLFSEHAACGAANDVDTSLGQSALCSFLRVITRNGSLLSLAGSGLSTFLELMIDEATKAATGFPLRLLHCDGGEAVVEDFHALLSGLLWTPSVWIFGTWVPHPPATRDIPVIHRALRGLVSLLSLDRLLPKGLLFHGMLYASANTVANGVDCLRESLQQLPTASSAAVRSSAAVGSHTTNLQILCHELQSALRHVATHAQQGGSTCSAAIPSSKSIGSEFAIESLWEDTLISDPAFVPLSMPQQESSAKADDETGTDHYEAAGFVPWTTSNASNESELDDATADLAALSGDSHAPPPSSPINWVAQPPTQLHDTRIRGPLVYRAHVFLEDDRSQRFVLSSSWYGDDISSSVFMETVTDGDHVVPAVARSTDSPEGDAERVSSCSSVDNEADDLVHKTLSECFSQLDGTPAATRSVHTHNTRDPRLASSTSTTNDEDDDDDSSD